MVWPGGGSLKMEMQPVATAAAALRGAACSPRVSARSDEVRHEHLLPADRSHTQVCAHGPLEGGGRLPSVTVHLAWQ